MYNHDYPNILIDEVSLSDFKQTTISALSELQQIKSTSWKKLRDILAVNHRWLEWHESKLPSYIVQLSRSEKKKLLTYIYKLWLFVEPLVITNEIAEDPIELKRIQSMILAINYITHDYPYDCRLGSSEWRTTEHYYDFWHNLWAKALHIWIAVRAQAWNIISPSADITAFKNFIDTNPDAKKMLQAQIVSEREAFA